MATLHFRFIKPDRSHRRYIEDVTLLTLLSEQPEWREKAINSFLKENENNQILFIKTSNGGPAGFIAMVLEGDVYKVQKFQLHPDLKRALYDESRQIGDYSNNASPIRPQEKCSLAWHVGMQLNMIAGDKKIDFSHVAQNEQVATVVHTIDNAHRTSDDVTLGEPAQEKPYSHKDDPVYGMRADASPQPPSTKATYDLHSGRLGVAMRLLAASTGAGWELSRLEEKSLRPFDKKKDVNAPMDELFIHPMGLLRNHVNAYDTLKEKIGNFERLYPGCTRIDVGMIYIPADKCMDILNSDLKPGNTRRDFKQKEFASSVKTLKELFGNKKKIKNSPYDRNGPKYKREWDIRENQNYDPDKDGPSRSR